MKRRGRKKICGRAGARAERAAREPLVQRAHELSRAHLPLLPARLRARPAPGWCTPQHPAYSFDCHPPLVSQLCAQSCSACCLQYSEGARMTGCEANTDLLRTSPEHLHNKCVHARVTGMRSAAKHVRRGGGRCGSAGASAGRAICVRGFTSISQLHQAAPVPARWQGDEEAGEDQASAKAACSQRCYEGR